MALYTRAGARPRASPPWSETRPLAGRRVLVTRARAQAAAFVDLLADLGAEPIEAPAIRIAPPDDPAPLEAACANATRFDWIVFTSANGVDAFLERLLAGPGDLRALGLCRLVAVGPATAAGLRRYGLKADLVPDEHTADAISAVLRTRYDMRGARILLPRADIARANLPDDLRRAGADVVDVAAYRTLPTDESDARAVSQLLRDHALDVVTFTSASAVRNLTARLGPEPAPDLLANTTVAVIGPVTAAAARRLGITPAIQPATHTVPALATAIAAHFQPPRNADAVLAPQPPPRDR